MADTYRNRQLTIQVFLVVVALLLIFKAFQLQVLDTSLQNKANAAAIDEIVLYPSRGKIYDRNQNLLVYNNPMYDLMVTYNQVDPKMDTLKFCKLLGIDTVYFKENLNKNWRSVRFSKSVPFVFLSKITAETYAAFQESLYEFPGFSVRLRNVRGYPHPNAAHILGYIRETNAREVKDSSGAYLAGDYIGASGLEKQYETELRGEKGVRYILKDNLGKEVGPYKEGNLDEDPVSGNDLFTTIDLDLQAYGESLMVNKIGSIVAIEPATGEILSMISAPSYAPNQLTINQNRGKAFKEISKNPLIPLFNRSVQAQYPPGSLFKPVVALIALQMGEIHTNLTVNCPGGFYFDGKVLTGCHGHATCTNISAALQHSCNAYFVTAFREVVDFDGVYNPGVGLDTFNHYLNQFGLGHDTGVDFPVEEEGNYPTSQYFDKIYKDKNTKRWFSVWIRSLGIGQGELLMTNLQMANLAAILGNRGEYYLPHLVKGIRTPGGAVEKIKVFNEKKKVDIDKQHFEPVITGMEWVVRAGTATIAYVPELDICGKTGTAENNQGNQKDHSIFFAFAPKENPKIAIAVYVENGGWGTSFAAPIASLMIEKYLNKQIGPGRKWLETRMLQANLINLP